MARRIKRPIHVAGIIERHDNHLLIVRPLSSGGAGSPDQQPTADAKVDAPFAADSHLPWQFPRGAARVDESPEAAMRRIARELFGIEVEVVVGQPPLLERIDEQIVELRYFFCGIQSGEPNGRHFAELRWIVRGHLQEYDFDDQSRPVAEWLFEQHR
jgi:ADP-ribose pyrophosphatase YjhB (NUDIX family)